MTWLAEQPVLITAARVGKTLEMDPREVLRADEDDWLILTAAAVVVQRDEEKAAEQSRKPS